MLTGLLVPPRRASARDSSGQAPCPPGFGSGRGCFNRVRAPAVTGLRSKPGCLACKRALCAGAREGVRCGVNRRCFGPRLRLAVAVIRLASVLHQGGSPLITRQRSNGKQRRSPTGCGVSRAQQCVQLTSLRSWVRRRVFQIWVVVPARVIGRCRSATNAHVSLHLQYHKSCGFKL